MPYKCINCNSSADKQEDVVCQDAEGNCKVVKCSTVHYMHPDASGKKYATKTRIRTGPNEVDIKVSNQTLHLACTPKEFTPVATRTKVQVTCPDCKQFITSLTEE